MQSSTRPSPSINADIALEAEPPATPFSLTTGYAYAINYIIGIGILGIPFAMVQAGILLASSVLLIVVVLSGITAVWIVETTARAQAVARLSQKEIESTELDPLVSQYDNPFVLTSTKFELNELGEIFLGKWAKYTFTVVAVVYLFSLLWTYAAAFATSLTSLIPFPGITSASECDFYMDQFGPNCVNAYYIYMAFFAAVVVILSCLELSDQVILQVLLCFFRFIAITIIFATTMGGLYSHPYDTNVGESPPYISFTRLANFHGFGLLFPIAVSSQLLHHSLPGLISPLQNKPKIGRVIILTFFTTFTLYLITGVTCALYFGNKTKNPVTLNWIDPAGFAPEDAPNWAKVLSYFVFLFPVADMISAFPLTAVTFGNIIFGSLPDSWTDRGSSKKVKILTRLVAAFPPLLVATFVRQLIRNPVIAVMGTFGFILAFIVPAILQFQSQRVCTNKFGKKLGGRTPYSWHFSHPFYAMLVLVIGIAAFVYGNIDVALTAAIH